MQPENLVLPPDDICGKHPSHTPLEEFVHGAWFKDAHNHLCHNPDDFLCPLIFYIDKMGTDNKNKLGVEEVPFTFGIFKQSV